MRRSSAWLLGFSNARLSLSGENSCRWAKILGLSSPVLLDSSAIILDINSSRLVRIGKHFGWKLVLMVGKSGILGRAPGRKCLETMVSVNTSEARVKCENRFEITFDSCIALIIRIFRKLAIGRRHHGLATFYLKLLHHLQWHQDSLFASRRLGGDTHNLFTRPRGLRQHVHIIGQDSSADI